MTEEIRKLVENRLAVSTNLRNLSRNGVIRRERERLLLRMRLT